MNFSYALSTASLGGSHMHRPFVSWKIVTVWTVLATSASASSHCLAELSTICHNLLCVNFCVVMQKGIFDDYHILYRNTIEKALFGSTFALLLAWQHRRSSLTVHQPATSTCLWKSCACSIATSIVVYWNDPNTAKKLSCY